LPAKAVPEMIYTVSGGTLNPTHSLITSFLFHIHSSSYWICESSLAFQPDRVSVWHPGVTVKRAMNIIFPGYDYKNVTDNL